MLSKQNIYLQMAVLLMLNPSNARAYTCEYKVLAPLAPEDPPQGTKFCTSYRKFWRLYRKIYRLHRKLNRLHSSLFTFHW